MFEEKGRTREAAGYYFLAAYTTRTDAQTWEKIAYLYKNGIYRIIYYNFYKNYFQKTNMNRQDIVLEGL